MKANSKKLTPEENLMLMERIRDQRLHLPLVADDEDTMGNKHTEASWGLCTVDPEIITKDLRTWPDRTLLHGQVYGVRRHGHCPFDKRENGDAYGCFHRCRIFKDGLNDEQEARRLFEIRINQLRQQVGLPCTGSHSTGGDTSSPQSLPTEADFSDVSAIAGPPPSAG